MASGEFIINNKIIMESPLVKKLDLFIFQEKNRDKKKDKEKQNIYPNVSQINNISIAKNFKRRNSLILNKFKTSSNNIAYLMPKIYNNISEKVIINNVKNNSMEKLRTKMIIENKSIIKINSPKKEEVIIKNKNKKYKNLIEENKEILSLNNTYMFNTIIKLRKEKSRPQLLDEQWKYEKILLDYNIIDFTCKKII